MDLVPAVSGVLDPRPDDDRALPLAWDGDARPVLQDDLDDEVPPTWSLPCEARLPYGRSSRSSMCTSPSYASNLTRSTVPLAATQRLFTFRRCGWYTPASSSPDRQYGDGGGDECRSEQPAVSATTAVQAARARMPRRCHLDCRPKRRSRSRAPCVRVRWRDQRGRRSWRGVPHTALMRSPRPMYERRTRALRNLAHPIEVKSGPRGRSSVGRASASQAEGRGFEPRRPLSTVEAETALDGGFWRF